MIIRYIILILVTLIASKVVLTNTKRIVTRDRTQTVIMSLISIVLGLGLVFFLWFPSIPRDINEIVGFGENFNTLIFLVFGFVFFILLSLERKLDAKERDISKIVREIAVNNAKRNKKPVT